MPYPLMSKDEVDTPAVAAGRAVFESWHRANCTQVIERHGYTYTNDKVRNRWIGWQAHSAHVSAAARLGHCERPEGCVCGGDVPAVREGCSNWVKGGT